LWAAAFRFLKKAKPKTFKPPFFFTVSRFLSAGGREPRRACRGICSNTVLNRRVCPTVPAHAGTLNSEEVKKETMAMSGDYTYHLQIISPENMEIKPKFGKMNVVQGVQEGLWVTSMQI
jgi:hypothetical protein